MIKQPVAIIGIGCRFPGGVNDPQSFWELLINGVDAITEIPSDRWSIESHYHPEPRVPGKSYSRWGGFLESINGFEPECFGISPREAAYMDPQQRLLLEVTWEAIEDAGIPLERLSGSRTAVYVGVSTCDYAQLQTSPSDKRSLSAFSALGSTLCITANRLSYCLNLHGPSLALDTACSSSLVAVDRALKTLWSGESDLALAAGVNIISAPEAYISFCAASMLSHDGRCKAFDARADGFVRAEGAGVVLLKPLKNALRDGDAIYALVLGSGVNQDGRSAGISAPNRHAQEALLRDVYQSARIKPGAVRYIEAHGTGTQIGDPVEATALGNFFSADRPKDRPLIVGSVKTNIGHLEAASGMAGLIKLALVVQRRVIPANLHFKQPNPEIPFESLNLQVPTSVRPWPEDARPAIGGVNSFGFGGTNAHVVLSENTSGALSLPAKGRLWPAKTRGKENRVSMLLPLTGRSQEALQELAVSFHDFLAESRPEAASFEDICFSAARRRTHYKERLTFVVKNAQDARRQLLAFLKGESLSRVYRNSARHDPPKIAFVFCGQGTQSWRMGRGLLESEPVFRNMMERCDRSFIRHGSDWSLLEELGKGEETSRIDNTAIAQPAIFALQAAAAELWRSWGIIPDAVVGHSVGEIAAAYAAGIYTLDQAARLVFHRGRCMNKAQSPGRMLATDLTEEEAQETIAFYDGRVSLAAVNGPRSTTLSGEADAVEEIAQRLKKHGKWCKCLRVSHAFHSAMMDPTRDELLRSLRRLDGSSPLLPMVSTVRGEPVQEGVIAPEYWWQNVRGCVRFSKAIDWLIKQGYHTFLEVGPHPALFASIAQCAGKGGQPATIFPSLWRDEDERSVMLGSLGGLFTLGRSVNWDAVCPKDGHDVKLPRHPWRRESHWNENIEVRHHRLKDHSHPLLGHEIPAAHPIWQQHLNLSLFPYLRDHRVNRKIVFPAAGYVELALSAAGTSLGSESCILEEVQFQKTMYLSEEAPPTIQVHLNPLQGCVTIYSSAARQGSPWVQHSVASYRAADKHQPPSAVPLQRIQQRLEEQVLTDDLYESFRDAGLNFGPAFRGILKLWRGKGEALGYIEFPNLPADALSRYRFHPALLDSCFQVLAETVAPADRKPDVLYLPYQIERVRVFARSEPAMWSHARLTKVNQLVVEGDIRIYSAQGRLLAAIDGLRCRRVSNSQRRDDRAAADCLYEMKWQTSKSSGGAGRGSSRRRKLLKDQYWLIFADQKGMGNALVGLLEKHGAHCTVIRPGRKFVRRSANRYQISPDDPDDMVRLLESDASLAKHPIDGAIHLWSLDFASTERISAEILDQAEIGICHSLMHLVQAFSRKQVKRAIKLFLVTQGARQIEPGDPPARFVQSSILGFGRVIANEAPQLLVKLVDISPKEGAGNVETLLAEILDQQFEQEVAWRNGDRWIPRLVRAEPELRPANAAAGEPRARIPFRLEAGQAGTLDALRLRQIRRRTPGAGEVEIAVRFVALNFRDVLKALNVYPADSERELELGDECAGTVVAVGEGVDHLRVGDEVVAVAPGCFHSFLTVPADRIWPKPPHLKPEEAVTMPVAFLTAMYALNHLGKMATGNSVLIHCATGGVGLAAVQLARRAGAEIYATAGTPEKRRMLKRMGIKQVMDSRSLGFADKIRAATKDRGVDIVLNSLAGPALIRSASCLASHGRFLELGKRDIYDNRQVGLRLFRRNISFSAVDLGSVQDPSIGASLKQELLKSIESGSLQPLPYQTFAVSQVREAFRLMSQGKHVGKIVIDLRDPEARVEAGPDTPLAFSPDATYLITGGFGGFGLALAQWILEKGGRNLVLLGRRGMATEAARRELKRLRKTKARIAAFKCDVTSEKQLSRTLERIDKTMPPLRGIFHTAMVIDDGMLVNLNAERFRKVMLPKVQGTWNLHRLTSDKPLDHFVLFSSASAWIGNYGQANYAAANSFLEGFASYRRSSGLPAKAVAWGLLGETGYAAGRADLIRIAKSRGFQEMDLRTCLDTLEHALQRGAATTVVGRFDWERISETFLRRRETVGLLSSLAPGAASTVSGNQGGQIREEILHSHPDRRQSIALNYVRTQVARVLGASTAKIDSETALLDLGLDSLMAVDLTSLLEHDLGITLPIQALTQAVTIQKLTSLLLEQMSSEVIPRAAGRWEEQSSAVAGTCSDGYVVRLRNGGRRAPLFLIHPAGGELGIYRHLADSLSAELPIYGIQSPPRRGSEEHSSLDEMATGYAEAIRKIWPGPYRLFGFSLGGYLAVRIAQTLESSGQTVSLVGVAEWDFGEKGDDHSKTRRLTNLILSTYGRIEKELGILTPLPPDQLTGEAADLASQLLANNSEKGSGVILRWLAEKQYVLQDVPKIVMEDYLSRVATHVSMLAGDLRVEAMKSPLCLWRAREGFCGPFRFRRQVSRSQVIEEVLDGDHFTIMDPPQVNVLAGQLEGYLTQFIGPA